MRARRLVWIAGWSLAAVTLISGGSAAQGLPPDQTGNLPWVKGQKVVASVQGESITLAEYERQVAALRQARSPGSPVDARAERAVLDRMINLVLIAQEARRMGLDQMPEIRKMVETNAHLMLRDELVERAVKDVKADPKEVEARYRAAVRQWKITAVLLPKEEDARALAAEAAGGKDLAELGRGYVAQGRATTLEDGVALRPDALDPQIATAVASMSVGSVSPVIATKQGLVVLRLEEIRYPDDPAERARAEQAVLTARRKDAFVALDRALKDRYVKIHREVLDRVDYEAERPGIEGFLKDRRVVAEVKGDRPVTVADLTEEIRFRFFHGVQLAAERKRLNARKLEVLEGLLHRRVFRKEALRLGLDRTEAYRSRVREYENSALFGTVLHKVIAPGIKLPEAEIQAYYGAHRADYSSPEMLRLRSLAFADRKSAETAVELLKKGTDLQWVAERAEGQVDPHAPGVLAFDGRPIITTELPDGVRQVMAGARAGEVRLSRGPDDRFYALVVQDVVAAQARPYEQVRAEISEKLLASRLEGAVEEYAARLRTLSDVKVYLGP